MSGYEAERMPGDPLLTKRQAAERCACSPNHLYKLIRNCGFPRPLKLGRSALWPEAEVEAWIADRPRAEVQADGGQAMA